MKPIWDKGKPVNELIQKYTVGRDRELDMLLARYDILGSMAHITMLESVGLLGSDELPVLLDGLRELLILVLQTSATERKRQRFVAVICFRHKSVLTDRRYK